MSQPLIFTERRLLPRIIDVLLTIFAWVGFLYWHCCKVSDEAAFCLIQRPYISKTLLTRRISP
ncbi:hypothetical protein OKC77_23610, partial [Escherichia coli]|nr:hypothetical protein [Escherichia coli]